MHTPTSLQVHRTRRPSLAALLFWRLWLPRWIYRALPYLYLALALLALAAGLFLPEPGWALPYLLLMGLGGLHAGLAVLSVRRRWRRRRRQWDNKACMPASQQRSAWPWWR